jgi:3-isopropylmalate/(R)-2-methylmalate dehydratase small subunit
MSRFNLKSRVIPVDLSNIDTDQIIPKQFMSSVSRKGYGQNLFFNWRYKDGDYTKINPDFVLNSILYKDSHILLSRENFGCGSSREHAQWALNDFGIKVILAVSFADIFYQNCIYNQILPIALNATQVEALFQLCRQQPVSIFISLEQQKISLPDGSEWQFQISNEDKNILLNNLDSISITEKYIDDIDRFENLRKR